MNYYVLKSIEFGPTVLNRIYAKIEPTRLDEKLDLDRFSLREAAAHLADWEPIFRGRMVAILENPGVNIRSEDESERAEKNGYSGQDVSTSLSTFQKEREITAQLVRSLLPDDWDKMGHREGYGDVTVEDYANLLVCHDMYHIEHASQFL